MLSRCLFIIFILFVIFPYIVGPVGFFFTATLVGFNLLIAAPHYRQLMQTPWLTLWLGEACSVFVVYVFTMPLEYLIMGRNKPGQNPVLLIHGYGNNAGALFRLWWRLRRNNFGAYTINLEPLQCDIDVYAEQVRARLQTIAARSSSPEKITLICHSMGGLVARAYLRRYGNEFVARVITLGTPHTGTLTAHMARGQNGRQMEIGNPWLGQLATHEMGTWPCPITSIYSENDNIILPPWRSSLEGAKNIVVTGIGHVSLPFSTRVFELIKNELTEKNPA